LRTAIGGFDFRLSGWRRGLMACLAAVALAMAVSASVPSAALANDDEEDESFESKFIKKLFGINESGSINYRERPPLVVPPNLGRLPQPEANAVVNTPSWPKDPEVVERKKRAAAQKSQRRRTSEEDDRPLSPAELNAAGRKPTGSTVLNPTGPQDAEADSQRAQRPGELGYKGGLLGGLLKDNTKSEVATFKGEPTRSELTQPPAGYRTPSTSHPYGLTPRQEQGKPYDYINKRGTGE
jgi:hypothetical protein